MNAWWLSLSGLEHVLYLVAIPATLLLVLQTLLLLFGLHGGGDADGDTDGDVGFDGHGDGHMDWGSHHDYAHDSFDQDSQWDTDEASTDHDDSSPDTDSDHTGIFAGLKIFTLRGIIAFLSVFGWGSLWLLQVGLHPVFALFLGAAMGFWAMALIALLLHVALRLQSDGTIDLHNALGISGSVYLTIPANRQGMGKVSVLVQERLSEFDAVTDDPNPIKTGDEITVVGISGKTVLVVTKK